MDIENLFSGYKQGGNNYIKKADSKNKWCGFSKGHHEKSALPRLLANADAGQDMSLSRYFQGKPVFFVVPQRGH